MPDIINIVTSSNLSNDIFERIINIDNEYMISKFTLYGVSNLSQKNISNAKMWFFEAFIDDDPVGYRTAMQLIDSTKILLFINQYAYSTNITEGDFWISNAFNGDIKNKINKILNGPFYTQSDVQKLSELFPALNNPPRNRHA